MVDASPAGPRSVRNARRGSARAALHAKAHFGGGEREMMHSR